MKKRPAITVFDDNTVITIIKPYSKSYRDKVFVIYEDVFAEMVGELIPINDLKMKLNLSDVEFNELIDNL